MPIEQYTYWSVTLNNPTDQDYLIARNPNEKYVRQFVWTPEEGENGTPHIQGWLRCQRNMTMTAVKKLYPGAHLKPCDKDEYNERVHQYAQKDDPTTRGPHMITINDPLPSVERMLPEIYQYSLEGWIGGHKAREKLTLVQNLENFSYSDVKAWRATAESSLVRERGPLYAKVFVSPVFEKLIKKFGEELFLYWKHKQLEDARRKDDDEEGEDDAEPGDRQVCEGDEEGSSETDEGSSESSGDQSDEEDATSEY